MTKEHTFRVVGVSDLEVHVSCLVLHEMFPCLVSVVLTTYLRLNPGTVPTIHGEAKIAPPTIH